MIKKFGNYESTKAYGNYETLPRGAYVLEILNAEVGENQYGQYVKISCDIAEGEHKGFYRNDYKNQSSEDKRWHCNYLLNVAKGDGTERDEWTARRFKTVIAAIEDSNPGYHFDWDESKFKGKLVGLIFNYRQYEFNGASGFAPNASKAASVSAIRDGKFKVPKDKLLPGREKDNPYGASFTVVDTEDIPF